VRTLRACVVVVVAASAVSAHAEPKKEAERHFKLGVKLYNEAKWAEALVEFQRAYELSPHPAVLYNLAATHRELSHYDESIQNFERFMAEAPGKVKTELMEKATRELEELRARVGTIEVTTAPDGVTVVVDGREVGPAPLSRPLVLGPGEHVIEAKGDGLEPATKKVTLAAGDATKVHLELKARASDTPTTTTPTTTGGGLSMTLERRRWIAVGASMATNTLEVAETGAPTVGVEVRFADRIGVGVDVVAVAWAVIPSVRVRLAGDALQVHLIGAVPLSFVDGEDSEMFVAGAGGLGVRWFPTAAIAVRAEALVSYAGSEHGLTVPGSLGVELWF
jgi:hypothetical protein